MIYFMISLGKILINIIISILAFKLFSLHLECFMSVELFFQGVVMVSDRKQQLQWWLRLPWAASLPADGGSVTVSGLP